MPETASQAPASARLTHGIRVIPAILAAAVILLSGLLISNWMSVLSRDLSRADLARLELKNTDEYRKAELALHHGVSGPLNPSLKLIEAFHHEINPLVGGEFFVVARVNEKSQPPRLELKIDDPEFPPKLRIHWLRFNGLVGIAVVLVLFLLAAAAPEHLRRLISGQAQNQGGRPSAFELAPGQILSKEMDRLDGYCEKLDRRAYRLLIGGLLAALLGVPFLALLFPLGNKGAGSDQWGFLPSLTVVAYVQGIALAVLGLYRKAVSDVSHYQAQRNRLLGLLAALKLAGDSAEGFEERLTHLARTLNAGSGQHAIREKGGGHAGSSLAALISSLKKSTE